VGLEVNLSLSLLARCWYACGEVNVHYCAPLMPFCLGKLASLERPSLAFATPGQLTSMMIHPAVQDGGSCTLPPPPFVLVLAPGPPSYSCSSLCAPEMLLLFEEHAVWECWLGMAHLLHCVVYLKLTECGTLRIDASSTDTSIISALQPL